MLLIKPLNFVSKFLIYLGLLLFLYANAIANEPVDIWKKKENENQKKEIKTKLTPNTESKIDYKKKQKSLAEIKINVEDDNADPEIELFGLYDPAKSDLSLNMWVNTDGALIKDVFKRIEKIKLSKLSEKIFIDTIFTYSYSPNQNLSNEEFLKLKLNWLIENNKIELIEEFLSNNLNFSNKSKLIKYVVDNHIASANLEVGCEKISHISKEIKDNYLDKFRIYCLVLNKKNEEAQLNFDLLREEGRSDSFFDNKILFLLNIKDEPDKKISDKNLLYLYLSSITVEDFKYEPTQKTDKNIWKYLTASNLISTEKLEDPELINKYENAAHQGTFDKNKIFEIYLSRQFNINQLLNAKTLYQSLPGYEARALIYQKILLSDDTENQISLLFLLQDLFKKDNLENIYSEYLSDTLKAQNPNDIPEEFKKRVENNIILEKNENLGKIKFDDKILHRSKLVKIFTEENPNKDKISKDFVGIQKKISRNKKYFFSIKDLIILEALSSEGIEIPKDLNTGNIAESLTVPSNLKSLVDNDEIGMLMLKLVEIVGSDDVENLDPETLYFIVNLLNKAKIKKVRNQILNLTLPLRV
tara:strand:+ start:10122 stop:11879 length:1758 start_codon:yes stop_codon:yes gene_type:complete